MKKPLLVSLIWVAAFFTDDVADINDNNEWTLVLLCVDEIEFDVFEFGFVDWFNKFNDSRDLLLAFVIDVDFDDKNVVNDLLDLLESLDSDDNSENLFLITFLFLFFFLWNFRVNVGIEDFLPFLGMMTRGQCELCDNFK